MRGYKRVFAVVVVVIVGHLGLAQAEDSVIALESAALRAKPNFFAPVQANVPYGTKVTILSKEGAWTKIKHGGTEGWVHKSSFAKDHAVLHDIGKGEKAAKETYKDEVVTAGKGFNEAKGTATATAPEATRQPTNEKPKHDQVDAIEAREVSEPQMKEFMQEGGLESKVLGK